MMILDIKIAKWNNTLISKSMSKMRLKWSYNIIIPSI